jgi:4-diphosphocytidyl-2-C-methyl-D-erythritol kinase
MVSFPNCKINIGLNIVEKRQDGFHNLETIFYPLPLNDIIEALPANDSKDQINFTQSGKNIDGDTSNNLCIKAYELLKKDYPRLPPIQLHLHKNIPMGAGLGGGSADGAFTLQLLNTKFSLGISQLKLAEYSLTLGSDCPFFILNKACFASGRGEQLQLVNLSLADYRFALVHPGIHISTAFAFKQIVPTKPHLSLDKLILQPIETWKDSIVNDFEAPVFKLHPVLKTIKDNLYSQGAVYASMSGSGSAIYGIFPKGQRITNPFPTDYFFQQF